MGGEILSLLSCGHPALVEVGLPQWLDCFAFLVKPRFLSLGIYYLCYSYLMCSAVT